MTDLLLHEYEPSTVQLDADVARSLSASRAADLEVVPAGPNEWTVTPRATVGSIRIDGYRITIRPKIGIRNVLLLMGLGGPKTRWQHDVETFEGDTDLLAAMVQLLGRNLDLAFAQGLRRDYEARAEPLRAVRGRIDIAATMRHPGVITELPCRYEEHTANFELNRVLLAATERALQISGVDAMDRRRLHRHLELMGDAAVDAEPFSLANIDAWTPSYLDRHYEPAVRTAALLLRNLSMGDRPGEHPSTTFVVDMNRLVESFLTRELARRVRGKLTLHGQYPTTLDAERYIHIRPDIVLESDRRPVLVADIKYKTVADITDAATSDLFQLAAYAQVLGVATGVLITVVGAPIMREPVERLRVRGSGIDLHVWPIDLSGDHREIDSQLDRLATRLRLSAGRTAVLVREPLETSTKLG
jgi:5-methylcytosine-specific restriction enzyme subunit McrC